MTGRKVASTIESFNHFQDYKDVAIPTFAIYLEKGASAWVTVLF